MDRDRAVGCVELKEASLGAKGEFPFRWFKRVFGYDKVSYRGLTKNHERVAHILGFMQVCGVLKEKNACEPGRFYAHKFSQGSCNGVCI